MQKENQLYEAKWWQTKKDKLLCTLCPRYCTIGEGQNGFCFIRKNIGGKLYSLGYGKPTGFAIDPIEKKPLNHFLPGSQILSFGTAGCNLGCKFCQTWTTSKARIDDRNSFYASPEDVVQLAKEQKVPSIAFTYNDPTIFGEYVIDISKIAREENIRSVMVTAGYIDKQARKEVYKYIDAANVDLKAFSETFYHKLTFSHLQDILDTLLWLKNETDVWLEITTLFIPGENDSSDEIKQMIDWILKNLGDDVPLHFTAFHPDFKLLHKSKTPPETLFTARKIAIESGIKFCYTGNIQDREGQTTFCPSCKKKLIERDWHTVLRSNLSGNKCINCGGELNGVFS
ncbi:MAG: AmmeMemoRadiSam system radical SAM enzyme [Ignavibacteria bacterium]|nr:AmmeMemoRadiSam system radical SAM enzyme [Ignavibacteria bacterium]